MIKLFSNAVDAPYPHTSNLHFSNITLTHCNYQQSLERPQAIPNSPHTLKIYLKSLSAKNP